VTPEQVQIFSTAANIAQSLAVIIAVIVFIHQILQGRDNQKRRDEELRIERRANAWRSINEQIYLVNKSCEKASISPADAAQSPGEILVHKFKSEEEKTGAIVLLYQHLNLLHIVFLHRVFIDKSEIEGFKNWANFTIGAFIQAVPPLRETFEHVMENGDLYSDEFIAFCKNTLFVDYLKKHPLPIPSPL